MSKIITCPCGKTRKITPSREPFAKFCSMACQRKYRFYPTFNRKVDKNCDNCNKIFTSFIGNNKSYCNKECYRIHTKILTAIRKAKEKEEKRKDVFKDRECVFCKKTFSPSDRSKYCKYRECRYERGVIRRQKLLSKFGRKYISNKHTEWRRKNGVMPSGFSKGEEIIYSKLKNIFGKLEIIRRDRKTIRNPETGFPLELDFYIPSLSLAFEVDGETHRTECYGKERLLYQVKNDKIKEKICKEKGIDLVRIPYGDDIGLYGQLCVIDKNLFETLWKIYDK